MVGPCVRAIRRLRPSAPITVAADGDGGDYPAGVRIVRTTFDRQRNLNGGEAIVGVLDSMIEAAEYAGADWCWKIDPDTVLLNDAVLNVREATMAGYACPDNRAGLCRPGLCLLGCCYGLQIDLARRVRDFWRRMPVQDGTAEDVAITGVAYAIGAERHMLPVNQTLPYAMHFWRWTNPLPIERYRFASAVNLGNPGGTLAQQVELARRLVDQMPATVKQSLTVAKPHRVHSDEVERRMSIVCDKRGENGTCLAECASCAGRPSCRKIATWKPCPMKKW